MSKALLLIDIQNDYFPGDLEWNGYLIESNEVHHTIMASLQGLFADVICTQDYIKDNKGVL